MSTAHLWSPNVNPSCIGPYSHPTVFETVVEYLVSQQYADHHEAEGGSWQDLGQGRHTDVDWGMVDVVRKRPGEATDQACVGSLCGKADA